jgi:phosphatidylserine/phosphatidylglycerophosphate/cardiolipin synthase-like enzyme
MKAFASWCVLLCLAVSVMGCQDGFAPESGGVAVGGATAPVEVYFSPRGGCTQSVVRELNRAQETVLVQAYSFTSVPIAKALLEAHKRGVKVQVILDKSQRTENYSEADFLLDSDIPTWIDAQHAIAHNKVMVIDGQTLITGSFNFTTAAEEHNAENMLVIRDEGLAARYAENWQAHLAHSEPYGGRSAGNISQRPAKHSRRKVD